MKYFLGVVIVVVAAVIGLGLFLSGSPTQERLRRFDELRIQHLEILQGQLITFWQTKGWLPKELAALSDATRGVILPQDPQTSRPYEYRKVDERVFSLCATFAAAGPEAGNSGIKYAAPRLPGPFMGGISGNGNWEHAAGRVCFTRTIDPDFFQPPKPPLAPR